MVRNLERSRRLRMRLRERAAAVAGVSSPEPEAVIVRRGEEKELLGVLARLSPDDREVLRLKEWDELKHSEIGMVLGISTHAVDMRVRRAMIRLGRELGARTRSGDRFSSGAGR